ncbi:hypothetical protein [Alkalihalobacillus sp. BA299]|uniref:hypothetical protein n=1 Tax=Alkalihalobacillus sp. BA299 TaxID=2815938 RepID=UPI001ADC67B3|nr:hypothetical protein [Alkalihalobacillus sp. BA299]
MIFTEREIDRVVQSIIGFRKKWMYVQQSKVKKAQKVSIRKKRSQAKNWSKWKKRK